MLLLPPMPNTLSSSAVPRQRLSNSTLYVGAVGGTPAPPALPATHERRQAHMPPASSAVTKRSGAGSPVDETDEIDEIDETGSTAIAVTHWLSVGKASEIGSPEIESPVLRSPEPAAPSSECPNLGMAFAWCAVGSEDGRTEGKPAGKAHKLGCEQTGFPHVGRARRAPPSAPPLVGSGCTQVGRP